jgi:hypothetical protein
MRDFERASAVAPKQTRYAMRVASRRARVLQMDSSNKQCLEHLVKVVERMQHIEQEGMAQ